MVSVDSFLPSLLLALRLLKLNGEWDSYWAQKGVVTVCPPNVCLLTAIIEIFDKLEKNGILLNIPGVGRKA